jgi:hypothetical protein
MRYEYIILRLLLRVAHEGLSRHLSKGVLCLMKIDAVMHIGNYEYHVL